MRASDHERERVVSDLRRHNLAGRIGHDELERRVERALSAETADQLAGLMADLPVLAEPDGPVAAASGRIGWPGIRPFLFRAVVPGEARRVRTLALDTVAVGLTHVGFELMRQTADTLEFARTERPYGLRGWVMLNRERVVISFEARRDAKTTILIHGKATRKVRKEFARLVQS